VLEVGRREPWAEKWRRWHEGERTMKKWTWWLLNKDEQERNKDAARTSWPLRLTHY
jgi:hypothetical protein